MSLTATANHFFGIRALLDRFPNARAVATADVVKLMRQRASPEFVGNFWSVWFPRQIPDRLVIADELKGNVLDLEGHDLVVVEVGHTDTDCTTCLHVPSVGLVVAGDAAYNDVHLYLVESNAQTRREGISALDTIESLNPPYGVFEDGAYSEWLAVRKEHLCLIPEGVDDVSAAGIPVAYLRNDPESAHRRLSSW